MRVFFFLWIAQSQWQTHRHDSVAGAASNHPVLTPHQHPQNHQSPPPIHLPCPHWTSPCPPLVLAVICLPISHSMANSLLSLSFSLSHRVCQGRPGAWLPGGHSAARLHRLETSRSLFFSTLFSFLSFFLPPFFCFLLFTPKHPLLSLILLPYPAVPTP